MSCKVTVACEHDALLSMDGLVLGGNAYAAHWTPGEQHHYHCVRDGLESQSVGFEVVPVPEADGLIAGLVLLALLGRRHGH